MAVPKAALVPLCMLRGVVVAKIDCFGHIPAVVPALVICQRSSDYWLAGMLNKVSELDLPGFEGLQKNLQ